MHLFDYLDSGNGYKVRLLLAQLGQKYQWTEVDIDKGETRTPDFLQRNPNGRIPTLQLDDGTYLPESNAILWYLAEGSRFLPSTAAGARAGAAMDVLRAVQPRALRRNAAIHLPALPRGFPTARRSCRSGWPRVAPRSPSWNSTWRPGNLRERALQHRGHRVVRVFPCRRPRRSRSRTLSGRARLAGPRCGSTRIPAAAGETPVSDGVPRGP